MCSWTKWMCPDNVSTCMLNGSPFFLLLSMSCCRASLCLDSLSDSWTFFLMFSSILEWMKFLAFRPWRTGRWQGEKGLTEDRWKKGREEQVEGREEKQCQKMNWTDACSHLLLHIYIQTHSFINHFTLLLASCDVLVLTLKKDPTKFLNVLCYLLQSIYTTGSHFLPFIY